MEKKLIIALIEWQLVDRIDFKVDHPLVVGVIFLLPPLPFLAQYRELNISKKINKMCPELADVEPIYAKHPKLKKENVELLAQWLKTQPHLPELDELQIIHFLHSCCYQINDAQTTIENYFKFRTTSALCQNLTEEVVRRTLSSFFMPVRTPDDDAVLLVKMNPNPEIYNCLEHSAVMVAMMVVYFHQYGPANGLVVVSDCEPACLGHLFRLNVSVISQFLNFLQESVFAKIKHIHVLNSSPVIQRMFSMVKPFIKKSLQEKIKFYSGSLETFYEHVPPQCLPAEYGGFLATGAELQENNTANFFEHWELLKWHETQKIDESKKIKKYVSFFDRIFFRF